ALRGSIRTSTAFLWVPRYSMPAVFNAHYKGPYTFRERLREKVYRGALFACFQRKESCWGGISSKGQPPRVSGCRNIFEKSASGKAGTHLCVVQEDTSQRRFLEAVGEISH